MGQGKVVNFRWHQIQGKETVFAKKSMGSTIGVTEKRTNKAKLKGYKQGKQYTKNPKDVAKIAKKYR